MSANAMLPSPLLAAVLRLEEAKKLLAECSDEIDFVISIIPDDGSICVGNEKVAA